MDTNFLNSRVGSSRIHYIQAQMYEAVARRAEKSQWIRLAAPLVALGSSLLKAIQRVTAVGETAVKGIANIFAFPFTDKCELLAGLNQLFIKLPIDIIAWMFMPVQAVVGSVITTGGILFNPKSYATARAEIHDTTARLFRDSRDAKNIEGFSLASSLIFG